MNAAWGLLLGAGAVVAALRIARRGVLVRAHRSLDSLPDAALLLSEDGSIRWANDCARQLLRLEEGEVPGIPLDSLLSPADLRAVRARLDSVLEGAARSDKVQVQLLRGNSGRTHAECGFATWTAGGGRALLLVRDLTPQVQSTLRLEEARDRAERSLSEKSRFLAVLAHEIRTPLQAVDAALRTLSEPGLAEDERLRLQALSTTSAESLLQILDDLLELSRVEARVVPVRDETFDPLGVCREVAALFSVQAGAKGGSVRVVQEGEDVLLRGDAARIRQILSNLVGNAIRHAPGTEVELAFRAREESGGKRPCLWEVRDRGPGLSDEEVEAMFGLWKRGEQSTGTGLGLAIVRGLVEVMGGEVSAARRPGGGLVASVRLPLEPAAAPAAPEVVDAPAPLPRRAPRVLVAEDDRTNQMVIRRQLERLGCHTLVVDDGVEALERFDGGEWDLVLLDCQMPRMDGYQTCREIRRRESGTGRRTPVLAVTAWAMESDRDLCAESGMDEVLTKPLRGRDMADALLRWTDSDRPADDPTRRGPPRAPAGASPA